MPENHYSNERFAENDGGNLPQLKTGAPELKTLSRQLIAFELLKIFSIPMDIFTLNRTILNEALALSGGAFASIIHFDERAGGVKYIQKSNGAFEKKISVPRFYARQKGPLFADIKEGALPDERYGGYRQVLIAPFNFAGKPLCVLEIFFKNRVGEKKAAETMRLMALFEKCALLAIINGLIKARSFEMAGMSSRGRSGVGVSPAEGGFLEQGVALTRLTFASFVNIISDLLFISCPCEFCSILWLDKKTLNYRIVAEKTIYRGGGEKILSRYRDKSVKLIEKAVGSMSVISGGTEEKISAAGGEKKCEAFAGYLAAPVMNFKQSGGLALINKVSDGGVPVEFTYNDQLTALILTNYLGDFYNNFVSASTLENKLRSLSIIYSVSSAGSNLFETEGFGRSVKKTLEELARYLKIHSCALVFYDSGDRTLKIYYSLEIDIAKAVEGLFRAVKMDFWSAAEHGGDKAYCESGAGAPSAGSTIKLSEVNIFREAVDKFKTELSSLAGNAPGSDFEISLRPVSFHGEPCGYLIFIDACGANGEAGCGFIVEECGPETNEFMEAASNILISMIKARKNYLRLNELEKTAARMERLASIGGVAAGVAHEIRNPLGGISLFATSLAAGFEAGDSRRKWLDQIIDAVGRIGKIVSSLLDFSREEVIVKSRRDAIVLIGESAASVRHSVPPPGAEIKCSFYRTEGVEGRGAILPVAASDKFEIVCDAEKMKQVFANLIQNSVNAVAAASEGAGAGANNGTIVTAPSAFCNSNENGASGEPCGRPAVCCQIDIIFSHGASGETLIYFCDNGPGIPAEVADRIFRPFFTTRPKGTGLGLAITQKIIEAHCGTIKLADSSLFAVVEKKYGAVFELRLPV